MQLVPRALTVDPTFPLQAKFLPTGWQIHGRTVDHAPFINSSSHGNHRGRLPHNCFKLRTESDTSLPNSTTAIDLADLAEVG